MRDERDAAERDDGDVLSQLFVQAWEERGR
jgi:hypothetical protein